MPKREMVSDEPAECYLHEYGTILRHPAVTAKVNCVLTCDAVRGKVDVPPQRWNTVALVATEIRPEEREIIPGSARIEEGAIVADFWTKAGGNKRRVYTMSAAEARSLAGSLLKAADFADGISEATPAGRRPANAGEGATSDG